VERGRRAIAVGDRYEDVSQTTDEEVHELLGEPQRSMLDAPPSAAASPAPPADAAAPPS
jgi:hypothetical protein